VARACSALDWNSHPFRTNEFAHLSVLLVRTERSFTRRAVAVFANE
jgi:hypothetical protein